MKIEGSKRYKKKGEITPHPPLSPKGRGILIILLISLMGYTAASWQVHNYRNTHRFDRRIAYMPPVEMLKAVSLDYKGIVSKLLTFRGMVYYGERVGKNISHDFAWIYNAMDAATTLDPYNIDAYYFSQAVLPWEGRLVKETNKILERGEKYRTWDFYIPFFLGFNYFHFLKDNSKAAAHFHRAAKINPSLTDMAIKFHYKANEIPMAIAILKQLYNDINNEKIRKNIAFRIDAYQKSLILDKGIRVYKDRYKVAPKDLNQLIDKEIISSIPKDPYGGDFYYDIKEDRIRTTSNFAMQQR